MTELTAEYIESDPNIMMGKPVVTGTRITVESILERIASGESMEQIIQTHPRLKPEHVRAALQFAAETLKSDVIYPVQNPAGICNVIILDD